MGHTFLFREGLWRVEGEFLDGLGHRIAVEGTAQIRHYPDKWIYEGTLRTRVAKPAEHKTLYEIQPFADGNFATSWTSSSASLGSLRGRFLVVDDAILSAYESATGRYRGQDTIVRREDRRYSARGALFDSAKLLSAWAVELTLG
ncbi:MAG TPA: hypothetical protein VHN19_12610 [Burkholderiales bacterium]|jgi:hypothetical protein|nr:hypothetical protein [Burkholderiales bacterium]